MINTPKPDERAIMTYVSCYYHAFQGAQQVRKKIKLVLVDAWPPWKANFPCFFFLNNFPLCFFLKKNSHIWENSKKKKENFASNTIEWKYLQFPMPIITLAPTYRKKAIFIIIDVFMTLIIKERIYKCVTNCSCCCLHLPFLTNAWIKHLQIYKIQLCLMNALLWLMCRHIITALVELKRFVECN